MPTTAKKNPVGVGSTYGNTKQKEDYMQLHDTDLTIGIQELKKRFAEIRVDLRYLSYTAENLVKELNQICVQIEDLADDVTETDIIL